MKINELLREDAKSDQFILQQRSGVGSKAKWVNMTADLVTRDEAQEFLDAAYDPDEHDFEERAIATDGSEILHPSKKRNAKPEGKNVLARDASPEVHKRNDEFFKKYLG